MTESAADIRRIAFRRATDVLESLNIPEHTALAVTGSYARQELTAHSDLDAILIYDLAKVDVEKLKPQVEDLWYPVWDAKIRLDYSTRRPQECAAIISENTVAGLSLLDLTHVAGDAELTAHTRNLVLRAWRIELSKNFNNIIDTAITRWRRSGPVVSMTKPDLKHGRGGLRDHELLKALALGNLCDAPDLGAERTLLLDVRTMLHEHARRPRDVLDPEFAADIALDLGFADRYELSRTIAEAARTIDNALTNGLTTARNLLQPRTRRWGRTRIPRRPLDVDVVDVGGEISLSRKPNLEDPALVLRVAAASARTGLPIHDAVWSRLKALPPMGDHWPTPATSDFLALLSSPDHTGRVITELDNHGLWSPLVPAWDNIRGLMPREPVHTQTIDQHSVEVTQNCAAHSVTVARPDLLYLAALFHDIGKGQGRPHAEVGAELVADMADRLRLGYRDKSVVTALVLHHTLIPNLVAHRDIESDEVVEELLDALGYDLLTIDLMHVLVHADALAAGMWTSTLQIGTNMLCHRARTRLTSTKPEPPVLDFPPHPLDLIPTPAGSNSTATVRWVGNYLRESVRILALIAAKDWNINSAEFIVEPDHTRAELQVYNTLGTGFDKAEFIQAYKSGVYSALPHVAPAGTTATFWFDDVLEVRTTDRQAALGTLMGVLPEISWLKMSNPGATMIMQCGLKPGFDRATVERDVTQVLTTG
ncbi:MAG: [protein-PII] uridylyltransferase [Corynebacterium sp.]|nr:[protein-PII] uridylyltransferase [Corynebacterium sp.]